MANPIFDPELWSDALYVGAYYFEGGVREFLRWSDLVVKDLGERVRPILRDLWMRMPIEARRQGERKLRDIGAKPEEIRKVRERIRLFSEIERKAFPLLDASGKEVNLAGEREGTPVRGEERRRPEPPLSRELSQKSGVSKTEVKPVDASQPGKNLHGLAKVAGMREVKALLMKDVVRAFRSPDLFWRYGLSIPHGILLHGPSGCGKTYIACQLAEELGCTFIKNAQSDVASIYIHGSAIRIRELFETAEKAAPSVLFIDEFEGMVPRRAGIGSHEQYKSEEVNEFLVHLNDCAQKKILVIAATNEPEKIDSAVLRAGRMDKLVYVGPPDVEARFEMLRFHLSGRLTEPQIDLQGIATILEGYSASDIWLLVEEAAREALEQGSKISTDLLVGALARVPPSISEEVQERYRSFGSRGV